MGHYARGDSRNMICSSDEEEGYLPTSAEHLSRTNSTIAQMNLRDKRNLILGTFGEAPPLPLPPVSDETDRQFWAEDELSSCDSRRDLLSVVRRRRRRSVAHRNRAAILRCRSSFVQSSSSSTDNARFNVTRPVRRRRIRHRNCPGRSRVSRARIVESNVVQTKLNPKTMSRMVAAGNNLASGCSIVRPRLHNQPLNVSLLLSGENRSGETSGATRTPEAATPTRIPSKHDAGYVRKNRTAKIRPASKSKRKKID